MCFGVLNKSEDDIDPVYLADGSLNVDDDSLFIPEDIPHHIDNVFLNTDINHEDEILGFIYEAGNDVAIVYTSPEAEAYCDPFQDDISESDPFADSDIDYIEEKVTQKALSGSLSCHKNKKLQMKHFGSTI